MGRKKMSINQKLMIVETMEKNPCLYLGKVNPMYTSKQRTNDWEDLAKRLNQEGGTVKSVFKWQKSWTDIKIDAKKKSKKSGDIHLSDLDCRILALANVTGQKAAEEIDSKEGIIQCLRMSEDPSHNGKEAPECSDLEDSMDSSIVLAFPESRTPSVVETRPPPVVETRAPPVVETRAPLVAVTRTPPEVQDKTPPSLEEDRTLPDQTIAEVVVLDTKNCQKLIDAEEASGSAMKSIAFQLGQLVKMEGRKATAFERTASAFERIADAVDRLSSNFCA